MSEQWLFAILPDGVGMTIICTDGCWEERARPFFMMKRYLARWIRLRPLSWMVGLAVRMFAPKHRVGVGVVVLNGAGQVLLLKHVFHPYFPWGLPGGWLNRDEAPEAAARRELWEETGLQGTIEAILFIERELFPSHLGIVYLASVEPGQMVVSGEILEACWFDVTDLPPLLPFTELAIETAVAHAQQMRHLEELS